MNTLVDNIILTFLEEKAKFLLKKLVGGNEPQDSTLDLFDSDKPLCTMPPHLST